MGTGTVIPVPVLTIVSPKTILSDWRNALRARANFLSLQNRPKRWGTGRRSSLQKHSVLNAEDGDGSRLEDAAEREKQRLLEAGVPNVLWITADMLAEGSEKVLDKVVSPAVDMLQSESKIETTAVSKLLVTELNKLRKVAARNLHRSWVTIPHVTQFDEADITELEAFRKSQNKALEKEGVKLTMLAFLVQACARALRKFPRVNSSLEPSGEALILKDYVHIGIAVDTPNGLVVPVLRDADKKGLSQIATEIGELAAKARDRKLSPADMKGASFSISSLGGIGGTAFTPIVNWPEVAILGVSRSDTKPVWDGNAFQPRLMLPLSFSYDHRVIDGADAARFTTYLSGLLGDMRRALL